MNTNIFWHKSTVEREHRELQNDHKAGVIWLTGLSGSGKSTLAHALEVSLHQQGCRTFVLDGDNVRHGLSDNLGFSEADRKENIRRVGEVAKLMMEAGIIVITAFISPFCEDRERVRNLIPPQKFLEVYCNATLAVCESRDPKGLYKKARAGQIRNYTGIDSPYEAPKSPELVLNTGTFDLKDCVGEFEEYLKSIGWITNKPIV